HGTLDRRQFTAFQHEDAIGAFGEDTLHRAPGPVLVAGQLRERLRPVRHDLVGAAQRIEPTLISSDGGDADVRRLTLHRLRRFTDDESGDQRGNDTHYNNT